MKLIAGLGNPGPKYAHSRHNAGFRALDALAAANGIRILTAEHRALTGRGQIAGEKVLLAKPMTFMNLSGDSLRELADYYKLGPEDIIVIYDDIDLEPGRLRIRKSGSAGSHNGMKSVIARLGYRDFVRIRIGVGARPPQWDLADYVLASPSGSDARLLEEAERQAAEAAELILRDGADRAMNLYNRKEEETPAAEPGKGRAAEGPGAAETDRERDV